MAAAWHHKRRKLLEQGVSALVLQVANGKLCQTLYLRLGRLAQHANGPAPVRPSVRDQGAGCTLHSAGVFRRDHVKHGYFIRIDVSHGNLCSSD